MSEKNHLEWPGGTKKWYNKEGQYHREDGPAIEDANGSKFWFLSGKRHRENGPSVEWAGGDKWWFINGKFHREDGPAYEGADGGKSWYINGSLLTEDLFNKLTKGPVKNLPLYLGQGFDDYISERLKS